jgi:hypothetical protein
VTTFRFPGDRDMVPSDSLPPFPEGDGLLEALAQSRAIASKLNEARQARRADSARWFEELIRHAA